jgi:hypothetical protein
MKEPMLLQDGSPEAQKNVPLKYLVVIGFPRYRSGQR